MMERRAEPTKSYIVLAHRGCKGRFLGAYGRGTLEADGVLNDVPWFLCGYVPVCSECRTQWGRDNYEWREVQLTDRQADPLGLQAQMAEWAERLREDSHA